MTTMANRREVLALAGGATAAMMGNRPAAAAQAKLSDIVLMEGNQPSQAIVARHVSCAEVMGAYLDHIERFNPKVNAIVSLRDRKDLLAEAAQRDDQLKHGEDMGPLH